MVTRLHIEPGWMKEEYFATLSATTLDGGKGR
jgi:hypothetical protein